MKWLAFLLISPVMWGTCTPVTGYLKCDSLVLNHAKVPNTDRTNYPAGFAGTCAGAGGSGACAAGTLDLRTVGNGGSVVSASGFDITFTSDSGGTTAISCEQESYSASTGAVAYWVLIATASHTVDTTIYVSYGNAAIVTAQCALGNTAVWDSNYVAVYHFEKSSGSYTAGGEINSKANNNNLGCGSAANAAAGIVGGALSQSGASNTLNCNTSTTTGLPTTGVRTLETWVNGTPAGVVAISGWGNNGSAGAAWIVQADATHVYYTNGAGTFGTDTTTLPNSWTMIAQVLPAGQTTTAGLKGYLNGAVRSPSFTSGGTTVNTGTGNICVGDNAGSCTSGNIAYQGLMDEVRISNTDRSADYIATVYNNISSMSTFWTTGTVSTTPPPPFGIINQ